MVPLAATIFSFAGARDIWPAKLLDFFRKNWKMKEEIKQLINKKVVKYFNIFNNYGKICRKKRRDQRAF